MLVIRLLGCWLCCPGPPCELITEVLTGDLCGLISWSFFERVIVFILLKNSPYSPRNNHYEIHSIPHYYRKSLPFDS